MSCPEEEKKPCFQRWLYTTTRRCEQRPMNRTDRRNSTNREENRRARTVQRRRSLIPQKSNQLKRHLKVSLDQSALQRSCSSNSPSWE